MRVTVPFALSALYAVVSAVHLDINPIYIGDVFLPPSMHFIAWTASTPSTNTSIDTFTDINSPEWCRSAIDITDTTFSLPHTQATMGNLTGLRFHDYFSPDAHITRNGKKWGKCYVTPEGGKIGNCKEGDRWMGIGTRTWSCWPVIEDITHDHIVRNGEQELGSILSASLGSGYTGAMEGMRSKTMRRGPMGSEVKAAFTAEMTGR